jgi:hypothetical protein
MRIRLHHICLSAALVLVLPSCITTPGASTGRFFPNNDIRYDFATKTFELRRDLPVAHTRDYYTEGHQGLALLYGAESRIPKVIPKGARFEFDRMDESYQERFSIFPFFIGLGRQNVKYEVWLEFPDYKRIDTVSGDSENLILEYVWGVPGNIHVAPWEAESTPERRTKLELIRQIQSNPNYPN